MHLSLEDKEPGPKNLNLEEEVELDRLLKNF